ncbi:hypothetical protein L3Y34_005960 [Caenorhabditis briggsae]|uniref:Uncharacterized protein n=1 Tax=Caenorhabditis briggsae TaxID=6238 RepID=A0AAE8ZYC0_CAEBR|nr:hypothetical protein L3Y34_005960 [Caenorhabditis briggsae]
MDAAEIEVAFNNSDIVFSLFSPFSPARTTFKARTSGVLLVAGVGSFFAYRVASNLLGNRFVWECLDARHIDQLPTADRRLLYSFNEADEDEEDAEDQENEVDPVTGERRRRRRDSEGSRISAGQVSIGRLNRIRRSTRTPRGLLGSLQETPSKRGAGIVSRQSSRHSVASAHSVASIPFSSNSSVKSASFRIVWEGSQPTWDDFDIPSTSAGIPAITGQPSVLSRLGHVASTSSMRDGQSVGDLCSVFNDVMSVTSLAEGSDDPLLMDEDYRDEEDDESGGLLWRKCTANNTKYMYQSIAMETSEAGSDDGGSPKKRQFLDLGIDDDDEKTEQLTLLSPPDSETAMSNSKSRSMYDSAIGAEISSSEEGSTCPKRLYVLRETDNMSIAASSCASLEWCDDIDRNAASRIGFDEEKSSPLRLKRANLDWDLKSEVVPRALSVTSSSVVTREIEPKFAPKSSRDLMVMACEMFQPYSPPFRDLQTIYHRRRLKRIAIPSLPESPGSCVSLFMRSALYHKCSLLRDATWTSIEKRFDNAIHECDFMSKWPGYDAKTMRLDLKRLHELVSSESTSSGLEPDHHRAYQVLIVLEAKRAYDERLAGLFCEDWFDVDSPADVFRILTTRGDDELPSKILWNLLCRISGVSIEIIDARVLSERPKIHRFSSTASPKTPSLTWLRLGKRPVPLFYIPDDE